MLLVSSSISLRPDGAMVARQIPELLEIPEGWVFKSLSGQYFCLIFFLRPGRTPRVLILAFIFS
jgi:hypothetical protein